MEFIMGPNGPFELSEEQRVVMEQRRELHRMAKEDSQRSVDRLLEKLDADELVTLKGMLTASLGDDSYPTYMIGWIGAVLHIRYGVCTACGEKHDDEIPVTEAP